MAIKGKSKTRTKKGVTRGPKPVYVEVKAPFFTRRWVQVTAALMAGFLTFAFLSWVRHGLASEHRRSRQHALLARERSAVSEFKGPVDSTLATIGQPVQPDGFSVLPDMESKLTGFQNGDVTAKDAKSSGSGGADVAKKAWQAINGVDVLGLVSGKGFSFRLTSDLLTAKARMVDALKLYQRIGLDLVEAAGSTGHARTALLHSATSLLAVAKSLFSDGYSNYIDAESQPGVNLFQPQIAPPGVPQPGQPSPPAPSPSTAKGSSKKGSHNKPKPSATP